MRSKIKHHTRLNLFQRLFITLFSILTCVCILITGSFTLYFKQETKKTMNESIRQSSQMNAQSIFQSINQIELAISSLNTENSGLQEKMLLYNDDISSLIVALDQTIALLNNYISIALRPFTTKYHVYFFVDPSYDMFDQLSEIDIETASMNGQAWMYSNNKVCGANWYKLATEYHDQNHWFTLDSEQGALCFARCLKYKIVNNNHAETITPGVLFIKMDTSWIQNRLNSSILTTDTSFLLVDRSGTVLYKSDTLTLDGTDLQSLISEKPEVFIINDKEYSIQSTSVTPDLKLITLVPLSQLHSNYMRTLFPFLMLFVITLLIGTFFSIYISHRMTRDILHLANHMRKGNLTTIEPERFIQDEDIDLLYENYNLLVKTTNESIEKKLEYELNLLQTQINPHFLCNSLNSVYNVALLHKEANIASALSGLCSYLRYNVSSPNIEVLLQQELDMLEKYVSLQNFLCGDCIFFDYNLQAINPEQTKIPKMLLQPLVENCIMHNGENEFIEINITCTIDEYVLRLIVKDNGTKKEVDSINSSLSNINTQDTKLKTHGFGISNVHQRIKMKYGEQYGLHYVTSEEGGIVAYIELPACVAVSSSESN